MEISAFILLFFHGFRFSVLGYINGNSLYIYYLGMKGMRGMRGMKGIWGKRGMKIRGRGDWGGGDDKCY